ncbi:MAG TPA: hypothetical protein VJ672_01830 [Gemmatimonadaceae bacterium]|nr:hypothetical protein [Gemmatimonadaceae bacterium]
MRKLSVLASLASFAVLTIACARVDKGVKRDLARVRAATAAFKDITAARAAGYPTAVPQCIENPGVGGMGHHYVKRDLLDDKVDVERPEILIYAPPADGKPKLIGVEYIIPYRVWDREREAPEIFGQKLKRSDELKIWYLHVWAWENNRNGLFADWNPAVRCSHGGAAH